MGTFPNMSSYTTIRYKPPFHKFCGLHNLTEKHRTSFAPHVPAVLLDV